ncbi:NADH-quinone oxidoreductase subunit N [Ornithinimicrobium faecis]|uniref:NADH-quinone oxidoreductase subunit N n=1 Tax=Ornithinimicrobium faecis TaxID=2934158 RepID=UPI00211906A9|nr:proton-conducting transporter membrane subunit [Ornithinimicrobium sp. HY1745]
MTLDLNFAALWPVLAPAFAALAVLVLDVIIPRAHAAYLWLAAAGLVGGAVMTIPSITQASGDSTGAFCLPSGHCLYAASSLTGGLQLLALGSALVVLVLTWSDWASAGRGDRTSAPSVVLVALFLAATAGVAAVPAARDLGTLLVALELATLPVVGLVALERRASRHPGAVAGAVSLLTTSLVSFALLALGAALWVAATGSALLDPVAAAAAAAVPEQAALLLLAAVFVLAGLGFKLSAVPFHAWTPLTYATAPLPVTTFLAGTSKVAALGGMIVLVQALAGTSGFALVAVAVLAALTMTLGNAMALRQDNLVNLLAWSAIAQAGWLMLPLASLSSRAVHAAGGYLAVYVVATVLAFVVVIAVARRPGGGVTLADHTALARRQPLTAAALGLALLTLAGLPPAIIGLVAKVVVLRPVAADGTWWLLIVATLNIALGIAVYVRWLSALMARSGDDEGWERVVPAAVSADSEPTMSGDAASDPAGDADATTVLPTTEPTGARVTTAEPGATAVAGQSAYAMPWTHRVLIAVLALLLLAGSIAPVGIF